MKVITVLISVLVAFSCTIYAFAASEHNHKEYGATVVEEKSEIIVDSEHEELTKGQLPVATSSTIDVGNDICPVSGEGVFTMGDAVQFEYKGKIYNFCCAACVEIFKKDPEKYIL